MPRLGISHLIFSLAAAVFFVAMGILALPFPQTAQWFPLYVAFLGTALSLVAAAASAISANRTRQLPKKSASAAVLVGGAEVIAGRGSLPTPAPGAEETVDLEEDGLLQPDEEGDRTTLRGFVWLGVWLGFVLIGLLIGYVAASALWIGVWFRTICKWRWRVVIPVVVLVVALLLLAEVQLNISMPGSNWMRSIIRW